MYLTQGFTIDQLLNGGWRVTGDNLPKNVEKITCNKNNICKIEEDEFYYRMYYKDGSRWLQIAVKSK